MTEQSPRKLVCCKCRVDLQLRKTSLSYMGHNFTVDLPRCPECGLTYVSPELAVGRMAEVEMLLEDK